MDNQTLPENGSQVRFKRADEEGWKEGEFDAQNQMFIEIYALETITHNSEDILEWEYTDIP